MTARAWAALTTADVVWGSTQLAIMVAIETLLPLPEPLRQTACC